ncbi:MAG: DUF1523 family protein [Pseudomonadota bacterium]
MRYAKWIVLALLFAIVVGFLHYTLPRTEIVRITGTDIIRVDPGLNAMFYAGADSGNAGETNRDVRLINTSNENRRPRVYRNQDTGWGWPPYFKFDSADLQAEASDFISTVAEPEWVAIRSYGWRSELFSIYPNATRIWPVEGPETTIIPWWNIIILTLLAAIIWAITVRVIRFRRRRIDPVIEDVGEAFDDVGDAVASKRRRLRDWFRGR